MRVALHAGGPAASAAADTASDPLPGGVQDRLRDSARELEALFLRQLLAASGVFRASGAAGSAVAQGLVTDTLAKAVADSGALGLAELLAANGAPGGEGCGGAGGVSSPYGQRRDPLSGRTSTHTGVDLPAPEGTPIPAAEGGTVVACGPRGGYGNAVELLHDDGTSTLYAHAHTILVEVGERIDSGDILGTVGQTGRTTGPHLHLERRVGGRPVNPSLALKSYRLRAEYSGGDTP